MNTSIHIINIILLQLHDILISKKKSLRYFISNTVPKPPAQPSPYSGRLRYISCNTVPKLNSLSLTTGYFQSTFIFPSYSPNRGKAMAKDRKLLENLTDEEWNAIRKLITSHTEVRNETIKCPHCRRNEIVKN